MGNFDRGGDRGGFRGGNGGGFRGGSSGGSRFGGRGGDRGDRPVTMTKVVCSECGKGCEVPFRPTGDKPVYCNDCFGGKRDDNRGSFGDRAPKREFNARPMRTEVLMNTGTSTDNSKQFADLNTKLDRLIIAVEKMVLVSTPKTESKKEESLTSVVKKAVAPAKEAKAPAVKKVAAKKVVAKKKK